MTCDSPAALFRTNDLRLQAKGASRKGRPPWQMLLLGTNVLPKGQMLLSGNAPWAIEAAGVVLAVEAARTWCSRSGWKLVQWKRLGNGIP